MKSVTLDIAYEKYLRKHEKIFRWKQFEKKWFEILKTISLTNMQQTIILLGGGN